MKEDVRGKYRHDVNTSVEEFLERKHREEGWPSLRDMALEAALTDEEQGLVIQGLHALLDLKRNALHVAEGIETASHRFTERDFGIPQIRALIERLSNEYYGPPTEEETNA